MNGCADCCGEKGSAPNASGLGRRRTIRASTLKKTHPPPLPHLSAARRGSVLRRMGTARAVPHRRGSLGQAQTPRAAAGNVSALAGYRTVPGLLRRTRRLLGGTVLQTQARGRPLPSLQTLARVLPAPAPVRHLG